MPAWHNVYMYTSCCFELGRVWLVPLIQLDTAVLLVEVLACAVLVKVTAL
jgi:hypothetical protein